MTLPVRPRPTPHPTTGALAEWNQHMDECERCLRNGYELCPTGLFLSAEVIRARAALEAEERALAAPRPGSAPTTPLPKTEIATPR